MSRLPALIWLVASAAWVVAIAFLAVNAWPHMPHDISHTDPATRAAYDSAVMMHAVRYAALALLPPLLAFGVYRLFKVKKPAS